MKADKTKIVWEGESWRLVVARRTLSGGDEIESAYIDHPGAVVIVPWRESGVEPEILMLRQYRHSLRDSILELPAGSRAWDEDWKSCAQRELREETGFQAQRLQDLGQSWPAPGVSNEVMTYFLATQLHYDPLPQDIDEEIEVVPMRFRTLLTMALNGQLYDAKSVIGILRTAYFLERFPLALDPDRKEV
jgi:ADP-ribose pyrophosphatase